MISVFLDSPDFHISGNMQIYVCVGRHECMYVLCVYECMYTYVNTYIYV